MCRKWYQDEIAQRDRELFARSEHQELIDKERYTQFKGLYNQEKVKSTELRKTLAYFQAKATPSPWINTDPVLPHVRTGLRVIPMV
eukprot:3543990-Prorocentrum_lima.AAC.1